MTEGERKTLLVVADAGTHSGFAQVVHNVFERLVDRFDVHVIAANYKGDHWDTPLNLYVPTLDEPNGIGQEMA